MNCVVSDRRTLALELEVDHPVILASPVRRRSRRLLHSTRRTSPVASRSTERPWRRVLDRPAVHGGGMSGKRDRARARARRPPAGDAGSTTGASRWRSVLRRVDGAHRVDHPAGGQRPGRRGRRPPRRAGPRPYGSRAARHSSRDRRPPRRWIGPSTPPPPSSEESPRSRSRRRVARDVTETSSAAFVDSRAL